MGNHISFSRFIEWEPGEESVKPLSQPTNAAVVLDSMSNELATRWCVTANKYDGFAFELISAWLILHNRFILFMKM